MDGQKGRPISKPTTGPHSALAAPSRAHITDHLMEGGRRALLSVQRRRRRGRPSARARDRFGSEQQVHRSSVCPERVPATDCASERASECAALRTVLEVGVGGGGGGDRRQRQRQLWAAVDARPRRGVQRSISQGEREEGSERVAVSPPNNEKKVN